ncbi:MAG: M23 family metallopeptidase [Candidatus Dadabacteria bacterium]|nr:M23 family metallopeptidase [Candidatus Dadabacteria bacterium]MYE61226.1 M23 family metallopeptidase [Candidatus Dadabacteria bacterium]MYI73484.1 M23 family metallopeptidase [Candidatus Dadabacteria bacterium]
MLKVSGKQVAAVFGIVLLIIALIKVISIAEMSPPVISFERDVKSLGLKPLDVTVSDKGTGLSKVRISLLDAYGESVLVEKEYEKGTKSDVISVRINPEKLGIKSGAAELLIEATDRFMNGLFPGKKAVFSQRVTLDFIPPQIQELSPALYIRHGGAGVVIYKVSEDTVSSGVEIKDLFFEGYTGYFEDPSVHLAFFAYPYNAEKGEKIEILATDAAGNETRESVYYRLLRASYVKDEIGLSEWFLKSKVLPLFTKVYGYSPVGDDGKPDLRKAFLKINSETRKENDNRIYEIGRQSRKEILWKGKFNQLRNSKVGATFADHRRYLMDGNVIDNQYHLGYDLSVTKKYPVPASNTGVVVFAEHLGIYGNTVIIDHGMGVMSLYSHLSSMDVSVGDSVGKKDIVGRTGTTGLAVGDHLHFGVYVQGIPVRPLEWWDAKWINDNILYKVNYVKKNFGVVENPR